MASTPVMQTGKNSLKMKGGLNKAVALVQEARLFQKKPLLEFEVLSSCWLRSYEKCQRLFKAHVMFQILRISILALLRRSRCPLRHADFLDSKT